MIFLFTNSRIVNSVCFYMHIIDKLKFYNSFKSAVCSSIIVTNIYQLAISLGDPFIWPCATSKQKAL